ncbi:hypothetical protein [Armatimonas sp.]|uniref:hypothetical protein n=1 Tax=Armatimonas sp. TaxID=1872638 RepID=UPI00286C177E|nr:hypothetical protein [Armatimonas sp.]
MRFQESEKLVAEAWAKRVMVPKSPDGPVYTKGVPGKTRLKLVSKKKNQITDDDKWYAKNGITPPSASLPTGVPQALGEAIAARFLGETPRPLALYGKDRLEPCYILPVPAPGDTQRLVGRCLDFSKWQRAGRLTPILFAEEADNGIIYIATGINGYAKEVQGKTGYLSALDGKTGKLLWQTEPRVANALNFVVYNDVIFCGYGFTNEPDFVFVIDKKTGKTLQRLPVASGPEYLHLQGDGTDEASLLVRCYDTDYQFAIR